MTDAEDFKKKKSYFFGDLYDLYVQNNCNRRPFDKTLLFLYYSEYKLPRGATNFQQKYVELM